MYEGGYHSSICTYLYFCYDASSINCDWLNLRERRGSEMKPSEGCPSLRWNTRENTYIQREANISSCQKRKLYRRLFWKWRNCQKKIRENVRRLYMAIISEGCWCSHQEEEPLEMCAVLRNETRYSCPSIYHAFSIWLSWREMLLYTCFILSLFYRGILGRGGCWPCVGKCIVFSERLIADLQA